MSDPTPDADKSASDKDASPSVEESLSELVKAALASPGAALRATGSVNPYAFSLGVAAIFLLSRMASYLTPFKLYFSFQSFLYVSDDRLKWTSLGVKLIVPAFVGFILFYLPFQWLLHRHRSDGASRLAEYLRDQSDLTARCSGFFAALLMAWPFIVYWDLMVPPNLHQHRIAFYFIYFLYFVSYAYFASLGVLLAKYFLGERLTKLQKLEIQKTMNLLDAVRTSAMGVLTSGVATYLSTSLASAS